MDHLQQPPPALISIHDVMPSTFEAVTAAIQSLERYSIDKVVLLVVPGCDWQPDELARLHAWQQQGYRLAGHGWIHRCGPPRTWGHRLHSRFVSRNVAEHLSLDGAAVADLIGRSYDWFATVGLGEPDLYVPPAWAMGALSPEDREGLPFRYYETLYGLYDRTRRQFRRLPLLGFEADTRLRACFLRAFNAGNRFTSVISNRPIRVAIHPFDFQYRLSGQLASLLAAKPRTLLVPQVFEQALAH